MTTNEKHAVFPENQAFLNGDASAPGYLVSSWVSRVQREAFGVALFLAVMLGLTVVCAVSAYDAYREYGIYEPTDAMVSAVSYQSNIEQYVLIYTYEVDSQHYRSTRQLSPQASEQYQEGQTITIRYHQDSPDDNLFGDEEHEVDWTTIALGVFGGIALGGLTVLGAMQFIPQIRRSWRKAHQRNAQLLAEGQLITATVVRCDRVQRDHTSAYYVVNYVYTQPSTGDERTNAQIINDKHNPRMVHAGEQVYVLYSGIENQSVL